MRLPLISLVFVGCSSTLADVTPPSEAPLVRVATLSEEAPVWTLTLDGVTRSADRARVASTQPGRLVARPVRVGDSVERGQVLARLDSAPYRNQVAANAARVRELDARIGQLDRDLERLSQLDAKGSVARAERERLASDRSAAEAGRSALRVQLAESERQLADSIITAPFDGVVVAALAEPGETVGAGASIVELAGSGLEVAVEVPESAWVQLDLDSRVRVRLPALEVETEAHVVDLAGAGGARGGLFPVVVSIPTGRQVAGLTAQVRFELPLENAVVAPIRSIIDPTGSSPSVFVVDGEAVRRVPVEVGRLFDDGVSVTGVDAGEAVVVGGHAQLLDGQAVRVLP